MLSCDGEAAVPQPVSPRSRGPYEIQMLMSNDMSVSATESGFRDHLPHGVRDRAERGVRRLRRGRPRSDHPARRTISVELVGALAIPRAPVFPCLAQRERCPLQASDPGHQLGGLNPILNMILFTAIFRRRPGRALPEYRPASPFSSSRA